MDYECQVGLFLFLGFYLIKTKMWNNGLKGLKQQTSYSSVPLKQTDFLLDTPKTWEQADPKAAVFLICPVQNRACTYHQSRKGNTNGHTLKANWQLQVI